MCAPASFIVTPDKVYFSKISNSHDVICALIPDGGRDSVAVELVPPARDYSCPVSKWVFELDSPYDTNPLWYSCNKVKARTRKALKEWLKYHCCSQGEGDDREKLIGGFNVNQVSGHYALQYAGDRSCQVAERRARQLLVGQEGVQDAQDYSIQVCQCDMAIQSAGRCSIQYLRSEGFQTAGNNSYQFTGPGTTQATRWKVRGHWHVAYRRVSNSTSQMWYHVLNGVWRPVTANKEIQRLYGVIADLERRAGKLEAF